MKKSVMALLLAAMFLNGCASVYTGRGPNLNAKGAEATQEIEKFTMHPSFWTNGNAVIAMGPSKSLYQTPSVAPMINSISPEAMQSLERAGVWNKVGLVLVGISLGIVLTAERGTTDWQAPFWGFWGAGVAAGITSSVIADSAFERYNHDLKQKYAPQISYRFAY